MLSGRESEGGEVTKGSTTYLKGTFNQQISEEFVDQNEEEKYEDPEQ